jgi:hypothetical protein
MAVRSFPGAALAVLAAGAAVVAGCLAPAGCGPAEPLDVLLTNQTAHAVQASIQLAALDGTPLRDEVASVVANGTATLENLESRVGTYNLTVTVGALSETSLARVEACWFAVQVFITDTGIGIAQPVA